MHPNDERVERFIAAYNRGKYTEQNLKEAQMTTETLERPPAQLVDWRPKVKTGMPTSGVFILIGHTKSGKTTIAADFPDSYVLELEKGRGDRIDGRIDDEIPDLKTFREKLLLVMEDPTIKTVVIDTVDRLVEWLCDEIAQKNGVSHINERKKDVNSFDMWGELFKRGEGMTEWFIQSQKLVLLLAHCKAPEKDESGAVITPAGLNVPGKLGAYLPSRADTIGFTYKKVVGGVTEYYVTFQGGPLGIWGTSVDELNDKTIKLPKKGQYAALTAVCAAPAKEDKPAALKPAPAPAAKNGDKKAAKPAGRK